MKIEGISGVQQRFSGVPSAFLIAFSLSGCIEHADRSFELSGLTIATNEINQMVDFYSVVFGCRFSVECVSGYELYQAELAGVNILLCPNSLAKVEASQNRQQFEFVVEDLDNVRRKAMSTEGKIKEEIETIGKGKSLVILDPDGNTILFRQSIVLRQ